MKIDYSTSTISQYFLYADMNVNYSLRHGALACAAELPISLCERILHLFLAIFEMIPILGHIICGIEYALKGRIDVIILDSEDPYKRGQQFGETYREETQLLYALVKREIAKMHNPEAGLNDILGLLERMQGRVIPLSERQPLYDRARNQREEMEAKYNRSIQELQQYLTNDMLFEMQGLANGAGVSLEDVFAVHAFLDIYAGTYGCSVLASREDAQGVIKAAATNHFRTAPPQWDSSHSRLHSLETHELEMSITSHKEALAKVNVADTIQAMIFDLGEKKLYLSTAWFDAAKKCYQAIDLSGILEGNTQPVFLARNLDWPWRFLAPYTVVVVTNPGEGKQKFVNVTFPGYLGVLSGTNGRIALGCSTAGKSSQAGLLNTLLFREILENSEGATEADERIEAIKPASSMNLTIAGNDGVSTYELDPVRSEHGSASKITHF